MDDGYHCVKRWNVLPPISVAILSNTTTTKTREAIVKAVCDPNQLSVQTLDKVMELEADYLINVLRTMALSAVRHVSCGGHVDITTGRRAGHVIYLPGQRLAGLGLNEH
jgi:hypothetical protein